MTILYGLSGKSCKSYVLVKYFLLFYFAFVQFILLCFHFSDVTIVFKKEKKNGNQEGRFVFAGLTDQRSKEVEFPRCCASVR